MRRLIAVSLFHLIALPSIEASEPRKMQWQELHSLAGSTVEISLVDGNVVSGPLSAVATSALTLEVEKFNNPQAHAKGRLSIDRDQIQQLRTRHMRKRGRIIGTIAGVVGGLSAGGAAAIVLTDPFKSGAGAIPTTVVFSAVTAGIIAAGYYAGRSSDRSWTTILIVP